ncbi:Aldo/keto reductase [Earliella scabrosa]|nr:Aldo/keto reductase [Earliella scabrosa]
MSCCSLIASTSKVSLRRSLNRWQHTMTLTPNTKLKLNDGNEIPIIGLGTYEMEHKEAYNAVRWALEAGYRLIDSAEWYYNERECGRAIQEFCKATGTPREAIFYTTKLQNNNGYAHAKAAIQKSLKACGLGYIDLYLLHSPIGGPQKRAESWKAAMEAQAEGLVRSIGVSNFGARHLQEMVDAGVKLPALNQIDLHPFMTRKDIVAVCGKHGIALEAWAPLVRGLRFRHPKIVTLAKKYHKDPAHVLLRYSLQKGYIAIPKSISKSRIESNINVFDFGLTDEEVAELDALDEYLITDWDPTEAL